MEYEIYLDKNGFWTWSASQDGRVIILSTDHRSKAAAMHHMKKHRQQ